jgi:hypothetical protein
VPAPATTTADASAPAPQADVRARPAAHAAFPAPSAEATPARTAAAVPRADASVEPAAPRVAAAVAAAPPRADAAVAPAPARVDPPVVASAPQPETPPRVDPPAIADPPRRDPAGPAAPDAGAEFERRLARLKPDRSLRDAVDNVLAAWHVAPLAGAEKVTPDELEDIVHRRGLEDLKLTGNLSMLRLLDLPAILEIRLPGTRDSSFVTLSVIGNDDVALRAGGETLRVAPGLLDRVWFGDAHVVWRDFEWLGPTFGNDAKGPHVVRLQRLLTRVGVYNGAATGAFDAPTEAAVLGFQRSRRLDADCRVGRLTRIALYSAAGAYPLPTLHTGGAS